MQNLRLEIDAVHRVMSDGAMHADFQELIIQIKTEIIDPEVIIYKGSRWNMIILDNLSHFVWINGLQHNFGVETKPTSQSLKWLFFPFLTKETGLFNILGKILYFKTLLVYILYV